LALVSGTNTLYPTLWASYISPALWYEDVMVRSFVLKRVIQPANRISALLVAHGTASTGFNASNEINFWLVPPVSS
jgi:hypothetical protein